MDSISIQLVPWSDRNEWRTVKELLNSSNVHDMQRCYETLLMWKMKCSQVPSYIECTSCLLQVKLHEKNISQLIDKCHTFDHDLRLLYTTAIIRFVNHMTNFKGETIYKGARLLGIPDWIVNIRHDTSHGQSLPALNVLKIAVDFALQWLKDNYWSSLETLSPTASKGLKNIQEEETNYHKLGLVLQAWRKVTISRQNEQKYIKDIEISTVLSLEDLYIPPSVALAGGENFYKLKDCIDALEAYIYNELLTGKRAVKFVIDTITDPMFCSGIQLESFEVLVLHIQKQKGLSTLLARLFELAKMEQNYKYAADFLIELAPSIRLLINSWKIYRRLKRLNTNTNKSNNDLKAEALSIYQSQCIESVNIPVRLYKPPIISFDYLKGLLMNPNSKTEAVVESYWSCLDPPPPKLCLNVILEFLRIYLGERVTNTTELQMSDKVFEIKDLPVVESHSKENQLEDDSVTWKYCKQDSEVWRDSPLGKLPWQTDINTHLEIKSSNLLNSKKRTLEMAGSDSKRACLSNGNA